MLKGNTPPPPEPFRHKEGYQVVCERLEQVLNEIEELEDLADILFKQAEELR